MNRVSRFKSKEITFPEKIVIALPFDDADKLTEIRAISEKNVDFDKKSEADVCTLSFAATEIKKYLKRISDVKIEYAKTGAVNNCFVIELSVGSEADGSDYSIAPTASGVLIYGASRRGALYGAYTFLYEQGIRWYYPGKEGEEIPENAKTLWVPEEETTFTPDIEFRGFDIYQPLKDSEQFLLWMARNRMNFATAHPYTSKFGTKLGLVYRGVGGHIFDKILNPDLPFGDGKTIWEAHPEWFGLPADGVRKKETAQRMQFCVSQPSLIDYLAGAVIEKLRTDWHDVSMPDIMGFDAFPESACHCEACQKIGNGTDRFLYFLSEIRKRIDMEKDLHPVSLLGCAYDATRTLDPPTHPVPDNLKNDFMLFYPIRKCYMHGMDDPDCETNSFYYEKLKGWADDTTGVKLGCGEYYNLSRYEDLPLIFTKILKHNLPVYKKLGVRLASYMHPPLFNWGVRAINHLLHAELLWNTEADAEALEAEYFEKLYGEYADEMKKVYAIMEEGTEHIATYRSHWQSVLDVLQTWAGGDPIKPQLDRTGHLEDSAELIARLEHDLKLRKEALSRTEAAIKDAKTKVVSEIGFTDEAIHTLVADYILKNRLLLRLQELKRNFIYASDEIELFTLFTKEYVNAQNGIDNPELWAQIEDVYDRLASYFYPQKYISQEVESYCEDALTRTTLRANVDMRRIYRLERMKK